MKKIATQQHSNTANKAILFFGLLDYIQLKKDTCFVSHKGD